MTTKNKSSIFISRRTLLGAGAGSVVLGLAGCGGDALGIAGIGSGGTGAFSSGPIRGFGSILVGRIHYDEAGAEVFDDAGRAADAGDLRLGMVVDVSGEAVTTKSNGQRRSQAQTITVRSEIEGPVAEVDVAGGTFTVLGQQVRVTPSTVFEDELAGGLATLEPGQVVEVSGLMQGSGRYTATRVEPEDDRITHYKLRGVVSDLDTAARTLRVGGALVSWAGVTPRDGELANGRFVRIELETEPDAASGAWRARDIRVAPAAIARRPGDGDEVELEGHVASVAAADSSFVLLGMTVDYSSARFEDGRASDLAPGVRVEVEGRMSEDGSVLLASEVEFDDDEDDEFEVEGRITWLSAPDQVFEIRGVMVDYSGARFDGGSEADLAVGVKVEVEGRLSEDGVLLIASEVEFDDDDDELEGRITSVSTADRTFVVRGVTVDYSSARFEDGSASDLAPGVYVEVEGRLSADGSVLLASEIEFDD